MTSLLGSTQLKGFSIYRTYLKVWYIYGFKYYEFIPKVYARVNDSFWTSGSSPTATKLTSVRFARFSL